jgi:YhcN/YlaJ family sporulation lipoprotein
MKRKLVVILALVLVFALMFTACAARRNLQNPAQTRQGTTGLNNNNGGTGTGTTGTGTTTGTRTGSNNPYDLGYDTGGNAGTGNNPGYGGYGATGSSTGYGGYGTTGNGMGYGGYGATGAGGNYGGTGTTGNYGGLATNNYGGDIKGNYGGGATGIGMGNYGGGTTGMGNPVYYGGYGGYGGYNQGMYGGYGNDYRNAGGSNNSPNYGLNNTGGTTQANGIARSVEQMAGVDNATVVVNGTTAYVGIDTDGDLTGRNISYGNATGLDAVKRSCAQRVKSADPKIQTVYVSTDANFFERLRRVETGVTGGSPMGGFRNELTNLVRGLTPTTGK